MRTLRWKLDKADWDAFQKCCQHRFTELTGEDTREVEEYDKQLITVIIQIAEETIPKSTGGKRKKSVPWWDDNCSKAIKIRNRGQCQHK